MRHSSLLLFALLFTFVVADVSSWSWTLVNPKSPVTLRQHVEIASFNLSLSVPKSSLHLIMDASLQHAVQISFNGASMYYPAPSNTSLTITIQNIVEFWQKPNVHVSLLDPMTNESISSLSAQLQDSDWSGLSNTYTLRLSGPTVGSQWFFPSVADVQHLVCQFSYLISEADLFNSTVIAHQLVADQNLFQCNFSMPHYWRAGAPVTMVVQHCLYVGDVLDCHNFNGGETLYEGSIWHEAVLDGHTFCGETDVHLSGSFFTDRYYVCEFCWDSDHSVLAISRPELPYSNDGLFCALDGSNGNSTKRISVCAVYEGTQPFHDVSQGALVDTTLTKGVSLGLYGCLEDPTRRVFISLMAVAGVFITVAIIVGVVTFKVLTRPLSSPPMGSVALSEANTDA